MFPVKVPKIKDDECKKWLVGADILAFLRYILVLARTRVLGSFDRLTRNVTKARANLVWSMKTYWTWNYCGCWTTACLAATLRVGYAAHSDGIFGNWINAHKFTCKSRLSVRIDLDWQQSALQPKEIVKRALLAANQNFWNAAISVKSVGSNSQNTFWEYFEQHCEPWEILQNMLYNWHLWQTREIRKICIILRN